MSGYLPVSAKDLRWLNLACKAAEKNDAGVYRLAAIAVKGGSVLNIGINKHRNNPLWLPELARTEWSTHAEESCLKHLDTANGCTLYIVRITPGGHTALAMPCKECQNLAISRNISKIIYTTDTGVETLKLRDLPVPVRGRSRNVARGMKYPVHA